MKLSPAMKTNAILLYLLFSSFLSFCQVKTPVIKAGDTLVVKLDSLVAFQHVSNNIRGVEVLDLRDDTSSIGYYVSKFFKKIRRLTFDTATDYVVGNWMCNYLKIDKGNVGDNLFVCLKKLRISNEATLRVFENGHEGQVDNGWDEGALVKIEFYLRREKYYFPLYRYDSLLNIEGKLPDDACMFLTTAFSSALSKLFTLNLEKVSETSRKLTLEDIVARSEKETQVPILIETSFKKGVYKTFDEFKMNAPSVADYEFKKGKFGDMLYVKEGDNEFPDRTAWGFCDGKNIFINSSDIFSELIRDGTTFYFKGIKSVTKKAKHRVLKSSTFNLATNSGEKHSVYSVDNKYYQIDMETGEVY